MNSQELLTMFDKCDFTELNAENYETNVVDKMNPVKPFINSKIASGISKMVLVPQNASYVIKIPFSGTIENYYYNSNSSSSSNSSTSYNNRNNDFIYYTCANNDQNFNWDYCFTESYLYHEAEKARLNKLFAKTKLIGFTKTDHYPIYIQQKAITVYDTHKSYPQKRTKKSINICDEEGYNNSINSIWTTDALEYYGEKKYRHLLQFLINFCINDLHEDNVGYINNKQPVIIDYSGWNEEC